MLKHGFSYSCTLCTDTPFRHSVFLDNCFLHLFVLRRRSPSLCPKEFIQLYSIVLYAKLLENKLKEAGKPRLDTN